MDNQNEPEINDDNLPEDNSSEEKELNKTAEDIRQKISQRLSKSSKANVAKKSMLKAFLPIITYALVFIIILIIIIGIVLFFITMPGMVMDKLKKLSIKIGNSLAAFFGGDTTKQIDKQNIYDVLDYLEEMGYDLKGYGFLTEYVGEGDGTEKNDEGKITKAESQFISTYLASDNYIYTIANFNQVNSAANNGHRILGGLISVFQKILNLATDGQLGSHWGRGMLSIYHEASVGVPGTYYGGLDDWLGWSDIKIKIDEKKDEKKLQIRRGWGSDTKEFNLEGWTGRYGMPLEFLLSVHIATMMPDLAYDMVQNFDTQVVILLHNSGNVLTGTAEYDPYIAYVKNHWYRDVYFVQADEEFVDYDYKYESITKERWTLYETYGEDDNKPDRIGEYKLYELDENGEYKMQNGKPVLFDGTQEEADEKNVTVAKKAVTLKYSDEEDFTDINWNKNSIGKWSAYKIDGGNITQTGDGLRTQTNSDIKKMFLENTYFRYDGSVETAEIITKLRDTYNLGYGAIKEDDLNKKIKVDGEDRKVSDFVGQVSLNQDALNAFSMLENEHTLDSDYIYRDFKELIVELGYFEKEELTDETPRLLQWIIPSIGSYGYPKRDLDKRENEYGTMAHSKLDYASKEVRDSVEATTPEAEGGTGGFDEDEINVSLNDNEVKGETKRLASQSNLPEITTQQTTNITDEVGAGGYVSKDFEDAGWDETGLLVKELSSQININTIGQYYSKGNKKQYEEFVQGLGGVFSQLGGEDNHGNGTSEDLIDAGEYVYGLMGLVGFNYCACCGSNYDYSRCTPYMSGSHGGIYDAYPNLINSDGYTRHVASNGHGALRKKIDDCMVNYNFVTNCNYTVDKVYYKAGLMGGEGQPRSSCAIKSLVNDYGATPVFEASELHFGDLIECFDSNGGNSTNPDDWSGWWHVMYVGEETEDTITIYETGHDYTNDGNWRREVSKDADRSAVTSGGWVGIHLWDLDYGEGNKYEGYKGNEEVVSPVTGVLLEYGTYKKETDSISGEEYRVNVDYKYGTDSILSGSEENPEGNPAGNDVEPPVDKVGYAKILVLDKENYTKLEKSNNNKWKNDSLISENGNLRELVNEEDDFKDWSDLDKTIYGYKEFLEDYETGGISGYIVYIDGFKCSLPGKLQSDKTVKDDEPITVDDYFESVNASNLSDKKLKSLYEKDEDYKLTSESATNKLNAENSIKETASASIYDSKNDLIFIKEGTVIGRTLTDKELLDDSNYRDGKYGTYEDIRENTDSETSVIGNYIRVIMRDTDGTVVENVEDYMKLDEKGKKKNSGDAQPYKAQPGDDVLLANMMHKEGCVVGFHSWGYSEEDAQKINMTTGYVLLNRAIINYENYGTTIREQLAAPGQYSTAYVAQNQSILCMNCYENAKLCLKYDCNYIKNPKGVEMTRDVLGQSGWDFCEDHSVPGKNCFWWVDDNFNGVPEEYTVPGAHFDEFFCYIAKYRNKR